MEHVRGYITTLTRKRFSLPMLTFRKLGIMPTSREALLKLLWLSKPFEEQIVDECHRSFHTNEFDERILEEWEFIDSIIDELYVMIFIEGNTYDFNPSVIYDELEDKNDPSWFNLLLSTSEECFIEILSRVNSYLIDHDI